MEKNKLMMIIIIVLLVVLLGTIGAVSFYALKIMSGANGGAVEQHVAEVAQLKPDEIEVVALSKAISTNLLTGADGKEHIISVTIGVGVDNTKKKESEDFIASLGTKDNIMTDTCISIISKKTYEELRSSEGQDVLKAEILAALQDQFQSNLIVKVYFSTFYTE